LEEKVFKSLIEKLSEAHERRSQSLELDPDLVARSLGFGSVVQVAEPLPETDAIIRHAEEDFDLPIDTRAKRLPPKASILAIASARLQSIKPQTSERQQQVLEMFGSVLEPLQALDEFLAILEEEHFQAIDKKWETIRQQGRTLHDSIPQLEAAWGEALNFSNISQEAKQKTRQAAEQAFEERKRISTWASSPEVAAAEQKLVRAQNAAKVAGETAFTDKQTLAAAESKLVSARENLRLFKQEMRRLEAELRQEPYFDPALGLSKDPKQYRDKW
jgi:hypothetical protein